MAEQVNENNVALEKVISTAVQIPGVKVNRDAFLCEVFKGVSPEMRNQILAVGPVEAGCTRNELKKIAKGIVDKRTLASTGASFVAGLPGGLAMAATIPADTLQFYAVALRLAQEISYIYGEPDLWDGGTLSEERVSHQLILYCGVMFGASGASATVRVLSSNLAKQALKKLPQQALTKTFYYPVIKSICKALGIRMTKREFPKQFPSLVVLFRVELHLLRCVPWEIVWWILLMIANLIILKKNLKQIGMKSTRMSLLMLRYPRLCLRQKILSKNPEMTL